jgi:hypothetical protein
MRTPFDDATDDIVARKYHNQRQQFHSDIVSKGILRDLLRECELIGSDMQLGKIRHWFNVAAPGGRSRRIDFMIGEPTAAGKPDLTKARICIEHKSVITAHRNKDARYDDLSELVQVLQGVRPKTIVIGTVLVGVAERFLNVADRITPFYENRLGEFEERVLPRLSSGDQSLWNEFSAAISKNKKNEAATTVEKFLRLPTRPLGDTNRIGFDFLLIVPMFVNNVDPPNVARINNLSIDVDRSYCEMLQRICSGYRRNWPG